MRAASLKALAAITIWGASFVATKVVVAQIDPLALVTLRTFGGAVVLYALMRVRGRWDGWIRDRLLLDLAVLGLVGIALHLAIQAVGLTLTSATTTGWMVALSPVFIALLSWRFLGERFGAHKVAGFALAMGGALLIVVAQAGGLDVLALPSTVGDVLVFSSAITWAVYSVLSKRVAGRRRPGVLMTHVMALGCLWTLPAFVAREGWQAPGRLDATGWLALGFLAVFVSALAQLFWYDALAELDASQVGVFLYIEPLVTLALAALLLGEPVRPLTLAGGGAILAGVWLVTRAARRPARRA
ncbi:MAG: DMT family transporter [Anaerolineae bacterium]|nr:DMT family transporter [Anaerolineae bacterium]